MTFHFLGTEAHIQGRKLERFGQTIELTPADGAQQIAGNMPILPAAEFQACGFTAEELERYAYPGPRSEPEPEFERKWLCARVKLHETRAHLLAGGMLAEGGD